MPCDFKLRQVRSHLYGRWQREAEMIAYLFDSEIPLSPKCILKNVDLLRWSGSLGSPPEREKSLNIVNIPVRSPICRRVLRAWCLKKGSSSSSRSGPLATDTSHNISCTGLSLVPTHALHGLISCPKEKLHEAKALLFTVYKPFYLPSHPHLSWRAYNPIISIK